MSETKPALHQEHARKQNQAGLNDNEARVKEFSKRWTRHSGIIRASRLRTAFTCACWRPLQSMGDYDEICTAAISATLRNGRSSARAATRGGGIRLPGAAAALDRRIFGG